MADRPSSLATRRVAAQRYDYPPEDIDATLEQFRELLESRSFLTLGDYCERFEEGFAQLAGTQHAVAVSSGTGALEIILRAVGVEGGEVVVPTNTFAATAFAVVRAGARPVFADIGADLNVDPDDVETRLSPDTRAVMTVHIGGLISPSVERLRDLCDDRGLPLVEDAAHAQGSRLEGQHAGTFGSAAGFSFFSTKVMTTGEGGMIVTDRDDLAESALVLRDQAKVAGANRHDTIGYNWRLTEFQAIMGLSQLRRLPEFVGERQRIARIYDDVFGGADAPIELLPIPPGAESNYYKYLLFLDGPDVAAVNKQLRDQHDVRMGGFVYDVPLHRQPAFAQYAGDRTYPVADDRCGRHVCPPIYPTLTDEDAHYVAQSLLEVLS